MKALILTVAFALSATAAHAMELGKCEDAGVDITTIMQPAAQNSRTFANNSIVVYNIDTEEPAAASAGLAIIFPDPQAPEGGSLCYSLTFLRAIDVMKAVSSYDANKGLLLTIPAYENIDGEKTKAVTIKLRINQAKGTVTQE